MTTSGLPQPPAPDDVELETFGPGWYVFVVVSVFQLVILVLLFGLAVIPIYAIVRAVHAWFRHLRLLAIFRSGSLTTVGWLDGERTFAADEWRLVEGNSYLGGFANHLRLEHVADDRTDTYRPAVFFITRRIAIGRRPAKMDRIQAAAEAAGFTVERLPGPFQLVS